MKRTISKIFCVIMALCVFLGAMPVMSFADNERNIIQGERVDIIDISPEADLPYAENNNPIKFYSNSNDADVGYIFYNQLTNRQKSMYNCIENAGVVDTVMLNFNEYYYGTGTTKNNAATAPQPEISYDIKMALMAVMEDNPMIFWPNGFTYNYSYYPSYNSTTQQYTVEIRAINLTLFFDEKSYTDMDDIRLHYDLLADEVVNFTVNGISRYEKVKSIHDSLCDLITYPENKGTETNPDYGPKAHHPTGALIYGLSVCEGYAEAFKLICDREGIPCITVLGIGITSSGSGAHKWNYVKMDDGLWYLLDATWSDQITYIYYANYLIGTDFDGGKHVTNGAMFSGVTALQYPTLATDTYSFTVPMNDTPDVAFNNTNNILYVGKGITGYLSCIGLPSNISGTISSSSVTGAELTLTKDNTAISRNYTVVMRGDINATDTVTTDDYNLVVSTATAKNQVTKDTAKFYAGDMTQDGAIDGFDAIALELYLEDTLKFN